MIEQPDIGRRGLLTGAFLTRQGRSAVELQQKPLGPQPSWLNSSPDNCNSCQQQCLEACPQSIIRLHPSGHARAGVPYLEFAVNGCTFCGDCVDECPSSTQHNDKLENIGVINIDHEKCLTHNGVFCICCVGKCDFGVFTLDKRRQLVGQVDKCCGCGMCTHACPVDALEVQPTMADVVLNKSIDNSKN